MEPEDFSNVPDRIRACFAENIREDAPSLIPGEAKKLLYNDGLLLRFYGHQKESVKDAAKMLERFLKWRKSFGMDTLTEKSIAPQMLENGSIYLKGTSREGNQIAWMHIKKFRKGIDLEDGKKLFALIFEKILWDTDRPNSAKVCIVLDMMGAGLANLDMELIRFAINMLQNFYPQLPEFIIPFQMPFVFKAAWNMIKSWLGPEALAIIKFCGPKEIEKYIDLSFVPTQMGGHSEFQYDYNTYGLENPDCLPPDVMGDSLRDRNQLGASSRSTESSTSSVRSKVLAMEKILNKSPGSEDTDSLHKRQRSMTMRFDTPAERFEDEDAIGDMSEPIVRLRNVQKHQNRVNINAAAVSITNGGRAESFVNVTWDPEAPNGVSATTKTYINSRDTTSEMMLLRSDVSLKHADRGTIVKSDLALTDTSTRPSDVRIGKHVSVAPANVDLTISKSTSFVVRNHSFQAVAFKLKLTNPEFVRLRPASGVLEFPDSFADIRIIQHVRETMPPQYVKIQVVTAPVVDTESKDLFMANQSDFWNCLSWKDVDKQLVRLKLRQIDTRSDDVAKSRPESIKLSELQFELECISTTLAAVSKQNEGILNFVSATRDLMTRIYRCLCILCLLFTIFILIRVVGLI